MIALTLRAMHESVKAGEPVSLQVSLKNISNHDINILREIGGRDSGLEVRDRNGGLLPDTSLGAVWNDHSEQTSAAKKPDVNIQDLKGNLVFGVLKPGQTDTWLVDASKFYEIREPGKYEIQVHRRDPENPEAVVKSNKVAITVVR